MHKYICVCVRAATSHTETIKYVYYANVCYVIAFLSLFLCSLFVKLCVCVLLAYGVSAFDAIRVRGNLYILQ